jgi:hypothetical protein
MTAALEQRYRRLLTCYPAEHRSIYAEEMIGVLLAGAPDGQRRPGVADTLDLVGGGARVRLRALLTGAPDPGWRDALALTSLIAPVVLAALALRQNLGWLGALTWHGVGFTGVGSTFGLVGVAVLLVPLGLGLLGRPRVGALAAAATVVWFAVQAAAIGGQSPEPRVACYLVLIAIEAVALTLSPGPRHALRVITGKGLLLALPWIAGVAYAGGLIPTSYPVPQIVARIAIAAVAVAGLPALIMPMGRRLAVLIAVIPGSAFVVTVLTSVHVQFYDMSVPAALASLYVPPLALAGLTFVAARRAA